MSGGIAPSKSTVYVSNLPFSLTNNDLHKIFQKHGQVVKVTIAKDRQTRRSKGIAFILFLKREDALACVKEENGKELLGRTIKCSIAKDNGRAAEFITKKTYEDKSYCYECKEEGHLSYNCPKNFLGDREPPKKKERKRKNKDRVPGPQQDEEGSEDEDWGGKKKMKGRKKSAPPEDEEEEQEESDEETLSAAIRKEQEARESGERAGESVSGAVKNSRTKIRPSNYFSDEDEASD